MSPATSMFPQALRCFAVHEAACPAVTWIKVLFVSPEHFQFWTKRLLPTQLVVHVPFPRWRVACHEVEFKGRWPAECAASRYKDGIIPGPWHCGEIVAGIFCSGDKRAEGENLSSTRQSKLIVFARANAQRDFWIYVVQAHPDIVDDQDAARPAAFVTDRIDSRGSDFNRREAVNE